MIGFCRGLGVSVISTTHSYRPDGSDVGRFGEKFLAVAEGRGLVDVSGGIETYDEITPEPTEIIIKKCRYSNVFCGDFEIILRGLGTSTVIVTEVTTEI